MVSRLRIASIIPSLHFGGDEKRLLVFATHLDRNRFDHFVILLRQPSAQQDGQRGSLRPLYADSGVEVQVVDGAPTFERGGVRKSVFKEIHLVRQLARILKDRHVDIIDARMNYAIAIGVAAGRLSGTPLVVGTTYHHHTLSGPLKYSLGQASVLALDALVSDSQDTIDGYQRWLLKPHPRALVIPNGIPPASGHRPRREILQILGIPDRPGIRIIGQVSRLMPFKGQEILIRAAKTALRESPDLHLLLCGFAVDPSYKQRLINLAREMGVAAQVHVVGYQGPVGDVWSVVDIHAHPTLQDSSPIAILEAMTLGLPSLVSDVGGISELVANEVSGLVVTKGDVAACEASLKRLLSDEILRNRLGAGARARYLERHTPRAMTKATEALFASLAGNDGSNAQ